MVRNRERRKISTSFFISTCYAGAGTTCRYPCVPKRSSSGWRTSLLARGSSFSRRRYGMSAIIMEAIDCAIPGTFVSAVAHTTSVTTTFYQNTHFGRLTCLPGNTKANFDRPCTRYSQPTYNPVGQGCKTFKLTIQTRFGKDILLISTQYGTALRVGGTAGEKCLGPKRPSCRITTFLQQCM